jgi:hypothetical protein
MVILQLVEGDAVKSETVETVTLDRCGQGLSNYTCNMVDRA